VEAAWVNNQHYPGCGCCEVFGKIQPDGYSWTTGGGTLPVQTWECCRGKIVLVAQQPTNTTTPTPSSCKSTSALVDDSIIFIAGGLSTKVSLLNKDLEIKALEPLPEKTHGPAIAYHKPDDSVFLCGGVAFKEEQICMRYSISTNNWKPIHSLPYVNKWAQGESVNGHFYIFGGNGGRRNVLRYNSNDDSWTILPAKIPFDFVSGCSTVIGDCRVALFQKGKRGYENAVFNAVTETFEPASTEFPKVNVMDKCAANLGKMNDSVGVMVVDATHRPKTHFFQLDPPQPGSERWEQFSTNNGYLGPVLGRISSNTMILGGNNGWTDHVKYEVFQNSLPLWENAGKKIPFATYGRSTQVPASWFNEF